MKNKILWQAFFAIFSSFIIFGSQVFDAKVVSAADQWVVVYTTNQDVNTGLCTAGYSSWCVPGSWNTKAECESHNPYVNLSTNPCVGSLGCIWGSCYTPPSPVGVCGTRNTTYITETAWPASSTYCATGTPTAIPNFPTDGNTVYWSCASSGGKAECAATKTPSPDYDLIVSDITWTPSDPSEGTEVIFSAVIKNIGSDPSPDNARIGVGFNKGFYYFGIQSSISPGGTTTVVANKGTIWNAIEGTTSFTAFVDDVFRLCPISQGGNCAGFPLEVTRDNNKRTESITVGNFCQKFIPSNASAHDTEESSGLTNNTTNWSYSATDTSTKCQYKCNTGYNWDGSACVAIINGSCGTSAKNYTYKEAVYSGTFCSDGIASPSSPPFPVIGGATSWICNSLNGGDPSATCTATRDNLPFSLSFQADDDVVNTTNPLSSNITVNPNQSFYLVWEPQSAKSCTATVGSETDWLVPPSKTFADGTHKQSFSYPPAETGLKTYNLECFDSASTVSIKKTVTVNVTPFQCQGTDPTTFGASPLDPEEETELPNGSINWTYSETDNPAKCEFKCNGSSTWNGSACATDGACGGYNGKTYYPDDTDWGSGQFCYFGTANPSSPSFPAVGTTTEWTCDGLNGGDPSGTCSATRNTTPPPPPKATNWSEVNP